MPVSGATGYPNYSFNKPGDPGNAWIPIIFSGKLLEKFYAKSTIAQITSTDYIGELKNKGDRVIVRTIPSITIKDYVKGGTLQLEYPESPAIEITVDRAKYFNFAMDDIDVNLTDINWLSQYADDAAQQLKIVIDSEFFADIPAYAHPKNQGAAAGAKTGAFNLGAPGSPITLSKTNIFDYIVDCGTCLDELNIPDDNRWITLPPIVYGLINKSDLRDAAFSGDSKSIIQNGGFTGKMLDRFNIYQSNLLNFNSGDSAFDIMFGRMGSVVSATTFTRTEQYRPQNTFADAMKGLTVYDWDVVNNVGLGRLYATIG
jgi:hypothetical protein